MGINPHQLFDRASRRQWVYDYHEICGPIYQNGSIGTIMGDRCMNSSQSLFGRSRELSQITSDYHQ